MRTQLDHIIIGAPDLGRARAWFEQLTGVMPEEGGSHAGLATRNALVSFGPGCYLEIVAPDPDQQIKGSFAEPLTLLDGPTIYHWVARVDAIEQVRTRLADRGATLGDTRTISRHTIRGDQLSWQMFGIVNHDHGGLLPLYINWQGCPHPSASAPVVGPLVDFTVYVSERHGEVQRLIDPVPDNVSIIRGETGASLTFGSPKGVMQLAARGALRGFRI